MAILAMLVLILMNGILSMAEIAIVSGKKSHILKLKEEGNKRAEAVMRLAENPNTLFSTIQIGITLIGILTGAVGAVAFSQPIEAILVSLGIIQGISHSIALVFVVVVTTYISVVFGELVPKRIGLHFSDTISLVLARPMYHASRYLGVFVSLLSNTTDVVLRIFHINPKKEVPISSEELKLLLHQGAQYGVFRRTEKHIVERTLNLSEVRVNSLMTAKSKIIWIDINETVESITGKVIKNPYSYFPVCEGSLDKVLGIISGDGLLASVIAEKKVNIRDLMYQPLLIPAHVKALNVLELFKKNKIHQGIVIDEYGNAEGLVTLTDILEAIVGNFPDHDQPEEKKIVQRNRTSWLVDGLVLVSEFKTYFKVTHLPDEKDAGYNTIGGFVMHKLGRVPVTGDSFALNGYKIEVVDMDGNRVDKLMVSVG